MSQPAEPAVGDSQETNYFDWVPSCCDDDADSMMPLWQPKFKDIESVVATAAGPLSVAGVKTPEADESAVGDPSSPFKKRKLIKRGSEPLDSKCTSVTTFQDQGFVKFPTLPLAIQNEKQLGKLGRWSSNTQFPGCGEMSLEKIIGRKDGRLSIQMCCFWRRVGGSVHCQKVGSGN